MGHFGDVSSLEYTAELITDPVEEYGRIDGVANFAGILRSAPIHERRSVGLGEMGASWGHFALLWNVAAHRVERRDDRDRLLLGVSSQSALGHHE